MVDFNDFIDESKVWTPEERQAYADELPEMSLFEDHILEDDPMVAAMQALIEEGETAETLAVHWKGKGNGSVADAVKSKKKSFYEHAIKYYTDAYAYGRKAIDTPSEDLTEPIDVPHLISTILSNRAAAQLALKNYGSCRSDCARSIKYWSKNVKAYFRGAKASLALHKAEDTLLYATTGLKLDPENKSLLKLKKDGEALRLRNEELRKQEEFKRLKRRAFTDKYRKLCEFRGVKVGRAVLTDERIKEYEGKVELNNEDQQIYWPVLILYDEYGTTDFVQQMGENDMFLEHLANMFPEEGPFCEWDLKHEYVASRLNIYAMLEMVIPYKDNEEWHVALSGEAETESSEIERLRFEEKMKFKESYWLKISSFCTLSQLLTHEKYVVPGVPMVSICVRDSEHEKRFLKKIGNKLINLDKK